MNRNSVIANRSQKSSKNEKNNYNKCKENQENELNNNMLMINKAERLILIKSYFFFIVHFKDTFDIIP